MTQQRLIERLATLVPPPHANQLLYGGVYAANARLRDAVVNYAQPGSGPRKPPARRAKKKKRAQPRAPNPSWAELMRYCFSIDVLACERCGGRMRHVATVLNKDAAARILKHLGIEADSRAPPPTAEAHYEPDEEEVVACWAAEALVDSQLEVEWDAELDQRAPEDGADLGMVRQVD